MNRYDDRHRIAQDFSPYQLNLHEAEGKLRTCLGLMFSRRGSASLTRLGETELE